MIHEPHAKEKKQYAEDEKWMAEPWTAWQARAPHISKEWVDCTHQPFWGLDGMEYSRRPDAPERCCRLCKYLAKIHCCTKKRYDGLLRMVDNFVNYGGYPDWCPLGAKTEQCDKCQTCIHTYEAKPRTIRLDAELPEPVTTNEVVYSCKPTLKFTVTLHSNADAEAWLKWWQEQVGYQTKTKERLAKR